MSLISAYLAGLISFLAPCLIPLIPSYFSVISGFTFADLYGLNFVRIRGRVFVSSLFFVTGFILFYTLLGATSTFIGRFLRNSVLPLTQIGGIFLIFLGLVQIGIIKFDFLKLDFAWRVQKRLANLGFLTAFFTGIISALVWMPCIGQVLGSILLLASQSRTVIQGVVLLFVYSLGISTPFLLLGLFFPTFFTWIQNHRKFLRFLSLFAGVILILFGLILLLNQYRPLVEKIG
jgi:cytochrome c-type biogenesis protein